MPWRQRWPGKSKVVLFFINFTNIELCCQQNIFYRKYVDGKERYVLVGAVTGNLEGCQDDLPDIYNFIGNEKVFLERRQA